MLSSIIFSLGLIVLASCSTAKEKHSNNCGSHPNDAIATLFVGKDDGSFQKICKVIVVKNNVAVGSNCNVEKHAGENLFISVSSQENRHLNVTHVRVDTISTIQFFYFENEQQLKKVCLNIKDLSQVSELFSLKQCNSIKGDLSSKSYMINVKDSTQTCKFNVSSQVILANCAEELSCSKGEFYGFAKVNDEWNLIAYDFEVGAPSATSRSEEIFETTQMDDFIQYLFDEKNLAQSDEFMMDYFDEIAKEIGQNTAWSSKNNSSRLRNDYREHLEHLKTKNSSDSLKNVFREHLKKTGLEVNQNSDLMKNNYNEYIKSLESIVDKKYGADQVEDKIKNANLNCKVTHGPNKRQEIKLSCKIVN